jgi:hypothetical protein
MIFDFYDPLRQGRKTIPMPIVSESGMRHCWHAGMPVKVDTVNASGRNARRARAAELRPALN